MSEEPVTEIEMIGVPIDLGAKHLGVDTGPDGFRNQDIIEKLTKVGLAINDQGDLSVSDRDKLTSTDPRARYSEEIAKVCEDAAKFTNEALSAGKKVLALGGDHSINLGVFSGASVASNGQIGLIYIDAHPDLNTPEVTLTGNIHGMHLAALLGHGPEILTKVHGPKVKLTKDNLLHIGMNDPDDAELEFIKNLSINTFSLFDLLTEGLGGLLLKIKQLVDQVEKIWVSLDLDVIDRLYAPAAAMPNSSGLTYREIGAIAEYIGRNANVVGVDVVEFNPFNDVEHRTAELGIELIAKLFGKKYSWYTNYIEKNHIS